MPGSKLLKFKENILKPYRLAVFNEENYKEVWTLIISKLKVTTFFSSIFLVLISLIVLIFIFTPLNRFLPAYANSDMQQQILINAKRVDSLEHQIIIRDRYFDNLKRIIEGKEPIETNKKNNIIISQTDDYTFSKSKHDSILRKQIEEEERFNLSLVKENKENLNFSNLHFFVPVKGIITNKFDQSTKHFGIDLVAAPNEPILATLDGVVLIATWTLATGYVIEIQHENNIISLYKHNSAILKQVGDHVKAGESIAIIGNSGEYTTGPHLHFELWSSGTPLNPEDYIVF